MAKTLADMTAEERADCVGMWASHQGHEDKDEPCGNLGIISEIDRDYAWIAFPKESAETYVFDLEDLIPRYDLPRAWTPDGEPVDMRKEYGQCEMGGTPDGSPAIIVYVDDGRTEYASEDTPHGEVHRWVGEWEKNNE